METKKMIDIIREQEIIIAELKEKLNIKNLIGEIGYFWDNEDDQDLIGYGKFTDVIESRLSRRYTCNNNSQWDNFSLDLPNKFNNKINK
jgi:hypothetical protein